MKVKALWPCKSATSQLQVVICSLETLNYSSLAETSPESFAFLGRIKLSAVSGSSAPACLLYLWHTTDKTITMHESSKKKVFMFPKDSLYNGRVQTLHVGPCFFAHNVSHKVKTLAFHGRSANVKAPAIECIWPVKSNV